MNNKNKPKQKSGIGRLLQIAGRRKGLLVLSGILATLHALLTLVPYVLIVYLLQQMFTGEGFTADLLTYLYWALGAISLSFLLMYASGMASHVAAFHILYELRVKIAEKLGRVPMGYLGNRSSGGLKKILSDDVERIETFVAHGIPDTVKAVALPVLTLGYLFFADWRLALISFIPLVAVAILVPMNMGSDRSKRAMKRYHQALEDMNAGIVEFVRAMPVMKIFGQSASAFTKYSGAVNGFRRYVLQWNNISAPSWGMLMSFLNNALLPVLALGLVLFFNGKITLPIFVLFLMLGVGYIRPVFALVSLSTQIVVINHGVKRMDAILFGVDEQQEGTRQAPEKHDLSFIDVSFAYTPGLEVLKNVSFNLPEGTVTALVGPSGSGKSTAAQLVARFYDIQRGTISIGGVPVEQMPLSCLMDKVGFVLQDNMMFYQSILENIRMGSQATMEQVYDAAKKARCHDFIMQLPEGYDTQFGAKGVHLSGGEQQRIQLARVFLKDAPILLLDEATAFSDPENEQLIMEACAQLIQTKTVLVIAHRLSTIAEADQIVVLDQGIVAGKGQHEQLLESCQVYKQMWQAHIRAKDFVLKPREVAIPDLQEQDA